MEEGDNAPLGWLRLRLRAGAVFMDGHDLRTVNATHLHRFIGSVSQVSVSAAVAGG